MSRGSGGIHKCRVALHFFNHLLVVLVRLDGGNAEGNDFDAAKIMPFCGKLLVQRLRKLGGVSGQSGIAYAHFAYARKCGLQSGEQLALELTVDFGAVIVLCNVSAHVGVEKYRVAEVIAVFAEAADADIYVNSGSLVDDSERNRGGSAVFVPHKLLGVEIVNSLILCGVAAECETLADGLEGVKNTAAEVAREDGRLRGGVKNELAGYCAELHDLALFDDCHALAVRNGDDGALGDDIVLSLGVAASAAHSLLSFSHENVNGHGIAVKILSPLVCHYAAYCAADCFYKSHYVCPLSENLC